MTTRHKHKGCQTIFTYNGELDFLNNKNSFLLGILGLWQQACDCEGRTHTQRPPLSLTSLPKIANFPTILFVLSDLTFLLLKAPPANALFLVLFSP